ncbi:MAG TPA: GNAT family N-acetyltransferase [Dehalococcoidales bacterium]|nr:GNAT family N-acetyltransferase [Dehalococcoidales bacterium]
MEIAVAQDAHVPGIVEVWKEFMDFHKDIDPHWTRAEDGQIHFENRVQESIVSEDALVLVVLAENRVVGYSLSEKRKNPPVLAEQEYGYISDMAVTANSHRQGIGEQMLARILQWFESHSVDRIELSVASANEIGYSFWQKHGFREFLRELYLQRK